MAAITTSAWPFDAAARDYQRAVSGIETAPSGTWRRPGSADEARATLHAAMVQAALAGVRPVEIERRTGYTKERVRQILRAGGVEPDWRPPRRR
ncbi:hypothetical protein DVH21_02125 [Micromonospora aurantiaca]|uniref:Uncharacterized protein n=1 Tax=Micromonospora aurantiaca (nom. illeg.) TaxID=47850 RepID=A0A6N3JTN9_9ACTN|nr:hypothetical protein DVH21_02125 [Micromonospora aurantiaca]